MSHQHKGQYDGKVYLFYISFMIKSEVKQGRVAKKPGNLEFDKLGKIENLEFYRKIMEKPGTFFKFEFFNNCFVINKCI